MVRTDQRNYGIDLLRIVSMMMVCTLHVLEFGGAAPTDGAGQKIALAFQAMCFGAVNCYALISGYVGVDSKVRLRNIVRLWLQVVCYCLGITLFFHILWRQNVSLAYLKRALFPVLNNQYWYFTAYFFLFFFMPYLNKIVDSLTEKGLIQLTVSIIFFFSVLQTFTWEVLAANRGYGIWWLVPLYLLGGCMRRLIIVQSMSARLCLLIYAAGTLIAFLYPDGRKPMMSYISPAILIGSMGLVLWFSKLHLCHRMRNIISVISPLSFGVYLLHVHPLITELVIVDAFTSLSKLGAGWFAIVLPLCALGLFAVCTFVEAVRNFLFKKLGINLLCEKIEKLLISIEDKAFGKLLVKE